MSTINMALVLLTAALVLLGPAVMARQIPGHISRAFTMEVRTLPSMEQFCSTRDGACIQEPVRIGGWNLQRFGISKMNKPEVVDVIVKVIHNYDFIVLQEVTDSSQTVIPKLITKVNEGRSIQDQYMVKSSPRIGRTSYKEQYVFVYKPARMSFLIGYQYNDSADIFQIEPYVTQFSSNCTGALKSFAVIPLHAKPSDAVKELDALVDVYDDMVQRLGITDAILVGDFNAGCNYVVQGEYEMMRLYTDQRFHWLISDHADTTTKTTSCPYDRIVLAGNTMQQAAYYKTASTYYFDEVLGIESNWNLVEDISDHYPVGVSIRGRVPESVLQAFSSVQATAKYSAFENISLEESLLKPSTPVARGVRFKGSDFGKIRVSVGVELPPVECWSQVLALVEGIQAPASDVCQATTNPTVAILSNIALVEWRAASLDAAVATVIQLAQDNPLLVTEQVVSVLAYKAGHNVLSDYTLYAPEAEAANVAISLLCRTLGVQGICTLSLSAGTGIN